MSLILQKKHFNQLTFEHFHPATVSLKSLILVQTLLTTQSSEYQFSDNNIDRSHKIIYCGRD